MSFQPIETERMVLRPVRASDAAPLADRRSHPEVAALQSWEPPFPLERATAMIENMLREQDLVDEAWWMLTVENRADGAVMGDLAIHPTFGLRSIEIGYTFHPDYWGHGYAVEAVDALVDRLFERPEVSRLSAMLHPDNTASERVLERTGFQYEGRTKLSYWVGDDNSDDLLYGMTREMRAGWLQRPREPADQVRLVEIDRQNNRSVEDLKTHHSQEGLVAPTLHSFSDALFAILDPTTTFEVWMRGIEADGEMAGFVMVAFPEPSAEGEIGEPYLWRLLVDRRHQRRGLGTRAVDLVADECRARGAASLRVSYVEERGGPGPLYLGLGFEPTGVIDDGETEARLPLS